MPVNEAFLGPEGGVQGKGPGGAVGCLAVLPSPLCSSLWAQGGLIPQEPGH